MSGRVAAEPELRPFSLDFTELRKLRKYHEISSKALADHAGVHWTTIYRLENNRQKNPSLKVIVAIARALGVPIHDLYAVCEPS